MAEFHYHLGTHTKEQYDALIAFPSKANWAYANRPASGAVFPRSKNHAHGK